MPCNSIFMFADCALIVKYMRIFFRLAIFFKAYCNTYIDILRETVMAVAALAVWDKFRKLSGVCVNMRRVPGLRNHNQKVGIFP